MSFVGVTKSVGKIQKHITYWLSTIFNWFFILARLIMINLYNWVILKKYFNEFYLIYFLVYKKYKKNYHCDIHIRSPYFANTFLPNVHHFF
jgi:hypothetical protein